MAAPALLMCVGFLVTGCFNSVVTQAIYNYAPINTKSMVLVLCAYIGYSLRYFIPDKRNTEKKIDEERGKIRKKRDTKDKEEKSKTGYLYMFGLVVAEILASQLSMIAFAKIGSGLHQVLYSSIILFTALVSAFVLHKKIYNTQWVALILLTGGLMLSAGRVNTDEVPVEGILYLFASTFIFAVTSSLSEVIIQKYKIPSDKYSMFNGFYGSGLIGVYVLVVTTGNWEEWVMEPLRKSGSTAGMVIVVFLMLILIVGQLIRGIVYYKCISILGSVSTGVLYALQAVCMFSLSAILFCDAAHPNQCFSITKGIGTVVVAAGVALYSLGKKQEKIKY